MLSALLRISSRNYFQGAGKIKQHSDGGGRLWCYSSVFTECRDTSVASVDMKWWKVLYLENHKWWELVLPTFWLDALVLRANEAKLCWTSIYSCIGGLPAHIIANCSTQGIHTGCSWQAQFMMWSCGCGPHGFHLQASCMRALWCRLYADCFLHD